MPKRTVNRSSFDVKYPNKIKGIEEKTEFLKSEIKDILLKVDSAPELDNLNMLDYNLGGFFKELMKITGKKGKKWVDYVNSEFDGISCWAEIKYVFSIKYPQENIEPGVEKEGLKMFYELTSANLNPDYWYYVTHTGVSTNLKTLAERRLNKIGG
jgi:hypothetical protein